MARMGSVFADILDIDDSQLLLEFGKLGAAERSYIGQTIPWTSVRCIEMTSGRIFLKDGRVAFIASESRQRLGEFAPDETKLPWPALRVWSDLLEPFLDTSFDDSELRDRSQRLAAHGLGPRSVRWIRCRVAARMVPMLLCTWEWMNFDQSDLISAWGTFRCTPTFGSALRYRRFRRWTDRIAWLEIVDLANGSM